MGPLQATRVSRISRSSTPHHGTFHRHPVPLEDDRTKTRFYRWHIDAALYGLEPPRVTSLLAVKVPKTEHQLLCYDDGSGDTLSVPRGSTVFASSYRTYDLLSDEDKKFARETKVQYAAHPYVWMADAKSRSDGLGMLSEGLELSRSSLPEVDEAKVKIYPMCWRNPVTSKLALQVHPSAIEKLHLADGSVIDDLEQVRERSCTGCRDPASRPSLSTPSTGTRAIWRSSTITVCCIR